MRLRQHEDGERNVPWQDRSAVQQRAPQLVQEQGVTERQRLSKTKAKHARALSLGSPVIHGQSTIATPPTILGYRFSGSETVAFPSLEILIDPPPK